MKIMTQRSVMALALVLAGISAAHAQYPTRPVRLIVPFAAGSGTDSVARNIQPQMSEALGQQLIIENRPGAAGNLGAEVAANAPTDGYTVLLNNVSHTISMTLYRKLGFDVLKDFAPVTLLASGSFTLSAHPSFPARSVKEMIALAKKHPGDINVATGGATIRLAAKLFDSMAAIKTTEVAYKSTPQILTAVISGEASTGYPPTSAAVPQVRAGKMRGLAVTSATRSSMAPDIPTIAESGVPGYEVLTWYGLVVPAATPKEIVARLYAAAASALRHPDVRKRFAPTDMELADSNPERFGAFMRSETTKWGKVVRESGMIAD